jgi:outer membrane protein assembly factor BamB
VNDLSPVAPARPLRLWPGVVLAVLLVLAKLVVPAVAPQATPLGVLAGPVVGLAVAIWWLFFSRAPWSERLGALLLIAVGMIVASRFLHVSIRTGMMGFMFPVYAAPVMALALVAWAVAARKLSDRPRRIALIVVIVLAAGGWTLVRTEGFSGYIDHDFALRWTKTPEERLLARANDEPPATPAAAPPAAAAEKAVADPGAPAPAAPASAPARVTTMADWPGFRGPARDGVVRGVKIDTDWTKSPPVELWRRPIGRAGARSPCTATCCTRRSSAAKTRSLPPTP